MGTTPTFHAAEFAAAWKLWWEGLQPAWRIQGTWPLGREVPADEDWSILRRGGNNGLFLVVMCLSWWGTTAKSKNDRATFEAAKQDVVWVLEKVIEQIPAPLPAKHNALSSSRATKRRRL